MANILTIDLEDWYQTNGLNLPVQTWDRYESRIAKSTYKLLDLLDEYGVRATFFALGCIAVDHPQLIKDIRVRGHEIGSHGGWHQMVNRMSLDDFRADLRFSLDVLQNVLGEPVKYYRAPSWSISSDRYQALAILQEEGIACDSSLQPFRTPLSGDSRIPVHPFVPVLNGRKLRLVEVPPSVVEAGPLRVPFSGGFYLRFWPSWFSVLSLRRVNRTRTGLVYVHPWELDDEIPMIRTSPQVRLVQYYNLSTTELKLRKLLASFTFVTLGQYIAEGNFPSFDLTTSEVPTLEREYYEQPQ